MSIWLFSKNTRQTLCKGWFAEKQQGRQETQMQTTEKESKCSVCMTFAELDIIWAVSSAECCPTPHFIWSTKTPKMQYACMTKMTPHVQRCMYNRCMYCTHCSSFTPFSPSKPSSHTDRNIFRPSSVFNIPSKCHDERMFRSDIKNVTDAPAVHTEASPPNFNFLFSTVGSKEGAKLYPWKEPQYPQMYFLLKAIHHLILSILINHSHHLQQDFNNWWF